MLLNIPQHKLCVINQAASKPFKKQRDMFRAYVTSTNPSWSQIIRALQFCGKRTLAREVCETCQLPSRLLILENQGDQQCQECKECQLQRSREEHGLAEHCPISHPPPSIEGIFNILSNNQHHELILDQSRSKEHLQNKSPGSEAMQLNPKADSIVERQQELCDSTEDDRPGEIGAIDMKAQCKQPQMNNICSKLKVKDKSCPEYLQTNTDFSTGEHQTLHEIDNEPDSNLVLSDDDSNDDSGKELFYDAHQNLPLNPQDTDHSKYTSLTLTHQQSRLSEPQDKKRVESAACTLFKTKTEVEDTVTGLPPTKKQLFHDNAASSNGYSNWLTDFCEDNSHSPSPRNVDDTKSANLKSSLISREHVSAYISILTVTV